MITAIVQFDLPKPVTLEQATALFEGSAAKYLNLAGLVRKYYILSEDGKKAGGVYLWETMDAAQEAYSDEWSDMIVERYGNVPEISFFHSPVIVDNQTLEIQSSGSN